MTDSDYLSQLNDAQRKAVEFLNGPQLVIAGAGSGKTRVLTYKIVHLLAKGHNPRRILALTFTNKAAREMRERIEALVGEDTASKLWMGTFHSIFSRILRLNADRIGFKPHFTIYDSSDSKSLVKTIIRDLNLDDKVYRPGAVLNDISMAKNALFSPEVYAADRSLMEADRNSGRPRTAEIYKIYRDRCHIADAMDFDDLLYYTNVLLRDNPDILDNLRSYFSYILVDEYQDTNFAQHLIVMQLCKTHQNLCVVGDDAQSIYSFRGANIRNILDLRKSFPGLSTFKLEQNYRSTRNIIGAANSLIAKNKIQIPKEVFSTNDDGERIEVVQAYNDYEEAYIVANRISQIKMRTHGNYDEFAILYRTNVQSRALEEALRNRNIPYRIYGGLAFYQRAEVKDAISYFRIAINPDDDEALRRIINKPARGIGETTLKKIVGAAIAAQASMFDVLEDPVRYNLNVNSGTAKKLAVFTGMVHSFGQRNANGDDAATLARYIITTTRLLAVLMTENTPESISKRDNIQELIKAVDTFVANLREQDGDEAKVGLGDFLAEVSLLTDQDTQSADKDCVTLMTIHSAKGLEFSNIFIVGVEEDLLPSAMSQSTPEEIEEERRLMYVAVTRAKKFCMASYARQRMTNGMTRACSPSRFLKEIDPRFLKLMSGSSLGEPTTHPSRAGYPRTSSEPWKSKTEERYHPAHQPVIFPAQPSPRPNINKASASTGGMSTHTPQELSPGMKILHPNFGSGEIVAIDVSRPDARITVRFSDNQDRTLLLKFARFAIT